jgi:putative transposase
LGALFKGAVSKDTVSRVWRKLQAEWEMWCRRLASPEMVEIRRALPVRAAV